MKTIHKPTHRRWKWTEQEDRLLNELVTNKHGVTNWTAVSAEIPSRSGKQCRERWTNHLSPFVSKGDWTAAEDHLLLELRGVFGNGWNEIAKAMPGRTDSSCKNRWNTWLRHQVDKNAGEAVSPSAMCPVAPEREQINKITSLLRTNPSTLLAALVTEHAVPERSPPLKNASLDALVGMVRATSRTELHLAAAALKLAVHGEHVMAFSGHVEIAV